MSRPSLSLGWIRKPEWACICGYRAPTQEQHCGSVMSPVIHAARPMPQQRGI